MHWRKTIVISAAILLLSLFAGAQQQDGSVLERRVNLNLNDIALENVLEQISWQAGVFFSYDATIVDSEKKCTVVARNKSLFNVLNTLFDSQKYQLTERENQIIISLKPPGGQTIARVDSIPAPFFFLHGKLVEQRRGNPVPYASVSVKGKPIGTIFARR